MNSTVHPAAPWTQARMGRRPSQRASAESGVMARNTMLIASSSLASFRRQESVTAPTRGGPTPKRRSRVSHRFVRLGPPTSHAGGKGPAIQAGAP